MRFSQEWCIGSTTICEGCCMPYRISVDQGEIQQLILDQRLCKVGHYKVLGHWFVHSSQVVEGILLMIACLILEDNDAIHFAKDTLGLIHMNEFTMEKLSIQQMNQLKAIVTKACCTPEQQAQGYKVSPWHCSILLYNQEDQDVVRRTIHSYPLSFQIVRPIFKRSMNEKRELVEQWFHPSRGKLCKN